MDFSSEARVVHLANLYGNEMKGEREMGNELRKEKVLLKSWFGDVKRKPRKKVATIIQTLIEITVNSDDLIKEVKFLEEPPKEHKEEITKRAEALKGLEFERVVKNDGDTGEYYILYRLD